MGAFEAETKRLNGQVGELVKQVAAGMEAAEAAGVNLSGTVAKLDASEFRAAELEAEATVERERSRDVSAKLSEALEVMPGRH